MKRMNFLLALLIATVFCLSGCANETPATAASSASSASSVGTPGIEASLSESSSEMSVAEDETTTIVHPSKLGMVSVDELLNDLPNGFECFERDHFSLRLYNGTIAIEMADDDYFPKGVLPDHGERLSGLVIRITNYTYDNNNNYDSNRPIEYAADIGAIRTNSADIILRINDSEKYAMAAREGELYLTPSLMQFAHDLMGSMTTTTETALGLTPEMFEAFGTNGFVSVVLVNDDLGVAEMFGGWNKMHNIKWSEEDGAYSGDIPEPDPRYEDQNIIKGYHTGWIDSKQIKSTPNLLKDVYEVLSLPALETLDRVEQRLENLQQDAIEKPEWKSAEEAARNDPVENFMPVKIMETTEEWPNGYEFTHFTSFDGIWTIAFEDNEGNMVTATTDIDRILRRDDTSDGWGYYYVWVHTTPYAEPGTRDPAYQSPYVDLAGDTERMIMHHSVAGTGVTKELAKYLKEVMLNGLPE